MNNLVLKIILAPLLLGIASLAGRRWGSAVSGLIMGIPVISGPIIFIMALDQGLAYSENAALGVLSGGLPLTAYSLVFSWLATRFRWPVALAGSLVAFSLLTFYLQDAIFILVTIFIIVLVTIILGLLFLPRVAAATVEEVKLGRWDIPTRMLIGMGVILLITGLAPFINPRLAGLLTAAPINITIMAIFTQRNQGPAAVVPLFRGLLFGLFAFAGFYITLGSLLGKTSIAVAFFAAVSIALSIQGFSLIYMKLSHNMKTM